MEYLTLVESKYRTLYRKQNWTVSKNDPSFRFYVGKPAAIKGITGGDGNVTTMMMTVAASQGASAVITVEDARRATIAVNSATSRLIVGPPEVAHTKEIE